MFTLFVHTDKTLLKFIKKKLKKNGNWKMSVNSSKSKYFKSKYFKNGMLYKKCKYKQPEKISCIYSYNVHLF